MPRQNITHLLMTDPTYRPDIKTKTGAPPGGFETKSLSEGEDKKRIRSLSRKSLGTAVQVIGRRSPKDLADQLKRTLDAKKWPRTSASLRSMRHVRKHLIAWLICLYLTEPHKTWRRRLNPAFVTLIPQSENWIVPGDMLTEVDAPKLLQQIRTDLTRRGGVPADGWAFFGLHGEYDRDADQWRIHAHGVVAGSMIGRCEALRKQKKYRSARSGRSPAPGKGSTPVEISRVQPRNLTRQMDYCFQSFWPLAGFSKRKRIPEPRHAEWLMWTDRYQPQDLCLMIGLRVEDQALIQTGKVYTNVRTL